MPELGSRYGYASFWVVCGVVVAALLVFFRRRGWLG
jgi:Mg2+ and Co2+ transporter CorA